MCFKEISPGQFHRLEYPWVAILQKLRFNSKCHRVVNNRQVGYLWGSSEGQGVDGNTELAAPHLSSSGRRVPLSNEECWPRSRRRGGGGSDQRTRPNTGHLPEETDWGWWNHVLNSKLAFTAPFICFQWLWRREVKRLSNIKSVRGVLNSKSGNTLRGGSEREFT